MPLSQEERDVRSCVLAACHRVGLYPHLVGPNSKAFLDRPSAELVTAAGAACPIGPPYDPVLLTFRQELRAGLKEKGYSGFMIFLQRLCTRDFAWRDFCEYHADGL